MELIHIQSKVVPNGGWVVIKVIIDNKTIPSLIILL
jgi:hypothetical protein